MKRKPAMKFTIKSYDYNLVFEPNVLDYIFNNNELYEVLSLESYLECADVLRREMIMDVFHTRSSRNLLTKQMSGHEAEACRQVRIEAI